MKNIEKRLLSWSSPARFKGNQQHAIKNTAMYECHTTQLAEVVSYDGKADDESLARLESIDSSQDVDRVGAEDREHAHINIVQGPDVQVGTECLAEEQWNHDSRGAVVNIVHLRSKRLVKPSHMPHTASLLADPDPNSHHEKRSSSHGGEQHLVPAQRDGTSQ